MKVYAVGGAVRDELLGRAVADRDYVVVGSTPDEMTALGFRPVGRDFPVFLHPQTNEEYALARTERKSGQGYHGFTFHAAPDVTLEQDLARRDVTINAMARGDDGTLIDPFGGKADLAAGVLRHVSEAFAEDPLRVLRVARFAARLGFTVAPGTEALMRRLAGSGELATLTPERVWQELTRALMEAHPSRFFCELRRCGALAVLLPEVDRLFGVPQPIAHHPELDAGVHVHAGARLQRRRGRSAAGALRGAGARPRQGGDAAGAMAAAHRARARERAHSRGALASPACQRRVPRHGAPRGPVPRNGAACRRVAGFHLARPARVRRCTASSRAPRRSHRAPARPMCGRGREGGESRASMPPDFASASWGHSRRCGRSMRAPSRPGTPTRRTCPSAFAAPGSLRCAPGCARKRDPATGQPGPRRSAPCRRPAHSGARRAPPGIR